MAAAVIVELPDTSTNEINKKLDELREKVGAVTLGRVLTLVIAPDSETILEESIEAANAASHEHPSRVIVVMTGDADAAEARLDAQLRAGGDSGATEVVVLRLSGPLAGHSSSVVVPFLLPDIPVVAWWPDVAPRVPAQDPLGQLAVRRITDATNGADPLACIKSRLPGYTPGDTDLAWSRVTYWRALLTVGDRPATARADHLGAGVRAQDRTRTRRPGGLAGEPNRRAGATCGRRAQSRTGAQQRDGDAEQTAGRRDGDVEPHRAGRRRLFRCPAGKPASASPRICADWIADAIYFSALEGIDRVEYV